MTWLSLWFLEHGMGRKVKENNLQLLEAIDWLVANWLIGDCRTSDPFQVSWRIHRDFPSGHLLLKIYNWWRAAAVGIWMGENQSDQSTNILSCIVNITWLSSFWLTFWILIEIFWNKNSPTLANSCANLSVSRVFLGGFYIAKFSWCDQWGKLCLLWLGFHGVYTFEQTFSNSGKSPFQPDLGKVEKNKFWGKSGIRVYAKS